MESIQTNRLETSNTPRGSLEGQLRDIRKQQKAERQFYQRDQLQQCTVCGRLFVRGKGDVCSMSCKAKAEQEGQPQR